MLRPPAGAERIGAVGLLDDRVGAEVRVPDGREDPRRRLRAVDDRAAVVDDAGHAAGEAGAGGAGRGQQAGVGGERRARRAEADDAAAAGQERVSAARLAALSVAGFSVAPTTQDVDVGGQRRGQRRRGDGLALEAERGERVAHLGAAVVGDDDLVGDRRAAPGGRRRLERQAARWSASVAERRAGAAPGSGPSRRSAA